MGMHAETLQQTEPLEKTVARLARERPSDEAVVRAVLALPDVAAWVRDDENRRIAVEAEVIRLLPPPAQPSWMKR